MGVLPTLLALGWPPPAIPVLGHLDHRSAIHGSTALRRRSSNTPIPCLNQLDVGLLLEGGVDTFGGDGAGGKQKETSGWMEYNAHPLAIARGIWPVGWDTLRSA